MLTLTCLIVGEGSVFGVEIEDKKLVSILKDEIKKKMPKTITCEAPRLTLYLAKKSNGEWINDEDNIGNDIETMNLVDMISGVSLYEYFPGVLTSYYKKEDGSLHQNIHVFVKLPTKRNRKEGVEASRKRMQYDKIGLLNGIEMNVAYLHRPSLVKDIVDCVADGDERFIIFSSPPGSGKTSILDILMESFRSEGVKCVYFSCMSSIKSLIATLGEFSIDLNGRKCYRKEPLFFMIDDVQFRYDKESLEKYGDQGLWDILKDDEWLSPGIRFFFSATHTLQSGLIRPQGFSGRKRYTRENFLLSDVEAQEFLELDDPMGLPEKFKTMTDIDKIKSFIIRECGGLIGALRLYIIVLKEKYRNDQSLEGKTDEILDFCISKAPMSRMDRLFGDVMNLNAEAKNKLIECLHDGSKIDPHNMDAGCSMLIKAGILKLENRTVSFTSRIARKFYLNEIYPDRAETTPDMLDDLIITTIKNMSALSLQHSTMNDGFPNEATFQHVFMTALMKSTEVKYFICPEHSHMPNSTERIRGRVDFYINSDKHWLIELLINGANIKEHLNRFVEGGKYYELRAKEYIVVDFRMKKGEQSYNITKHEHRITIFFQDQTFKKCKCFIGLENNSQGLELKD